MCSVSSTCTQRRSSVTEVSHLHVTGGRQSDRRTWQNPGGRQMFANMFERFIVSCVKHMQMWLQDEVLRCERALKKRAVQAKRTSRNVTQMKFRFI